MLHYMGELARGIVIGIANILPGISGGMLAVSMGVYDKIIHAVTQLFKEPKNSIRTLFPYEIGVMAGTVGLSFAFEYLFGRYPLQTKLAFIGLIAGGLPALYANAGWTDKERRKKGAVIAAVTFAVIAGLTVVITRAAGDGASISGGSVKLAAGILTRGKVWYGALFCLGILMAGTMVIPGVSGSMVLMMLGYYEPILIMTNACIRAAASMDIRLLVFYGLMLLPYFAGMACGVYLFARVVEHFLSHRKKMMYSIIMGLVCSSPFVILWDIQWKGLQPYELLMGIALCLTGYVAASLCGGEG